MRELDLTIIADRASSTSRTYLTYLKAAGYFPRKIIVTDFAYADERFHRVKRLVGKELAWKYCKWRSGPSQLEANFGNLSIDVQKAVPIAIDYHAEFNFDDYSATVVNFVASDFDDAEFLRKLRAESCRTFLYTSGGRVPYHFLSDPRIKVLHIHPGVVPYVRGSDGLFWSVLMRGRPGASCFFMDAGIDTGQLIRTRDFDLPSFKNFREVVDSDPERAALALLYFYDPHLRAQLFVDVVKSLPDGSFSELEASPQTTDGAATYFWMHRKIKAQVMRGMCA